MNRIAQRTSELAGLYLDGQAGPAEIRELEALLRDHEEARLAFLNEARLADGLRLMVEPSAEASALAPSRPRGLVIRLLAPLAAAAAVLIAVGVSVFRSNPSGPNLPPGTPYAKSVSPGAKLWRDGREMPLPPGSLLVLGDRIDTRYGGNCTLAYAGEATEVILREHSYCQFGVGLDRLRVGMTNSLKHLYMDQGDLLATVARQNGGSPLLIDLPNGLATVLGTRLRARANAVLSRLDVDEGRVRLSRTYSGEEVVVASNHYAMVGDPVDLVSIPTAVDFREFNRLRYQRADGAPIRTDDFESALSGWEPSVYSADHSRPLQRDKEAVEITEVSSQDRARTHVLRLYSASNEDTASGVMLAIPADFDGLSLEGDLQVPSVANPRRLNLAGLTKPAGTKIRVLYEAPAGIGAAIGGDNRWQRFRVEYTRDRSVPGEDTVDVKGFLDGCLVSWLTMEGKWAGFTPKIYFYVSSGQLLLDNLVLRQRVRGRVPEGLLAAYHFDEHAGTSVRDHAGGTNALDLTIGKPDKARWIPGALQVSGSARIGCRASETLVQVWQRTGEVSFEFWLAIDEFDRSPEFKYAVLDLLWNRGLFNYTQFYTPPLVSPATVRPRHFVMVLKRDGANVVMTIYNDGRLDITKKFEGLGRELSRGPFRFQLPGGEGYNDNPRIRPWSGGYHFLAIYDHALSDDDIRRNHGCGVPADGATTPDELLSGLLP